MTANPFTDDALIADLDAIQAEVKRRKRVNEPYASWAMTARMAALCRFDDRQSDMQTKAANLRTSPGRVKGTGEK